MALNKRILLLTCPIFIVIVICLASVAYSSFYSIPELQSIVQKGHIKQQLLSKSRDLQFLDYSLEAGYSEIFKQLYSMRSFYFQILAEKVAAKVTASPTQVKLTDMIDGSLKVNDPATFDKINQTGLLQQLEVSGWYSSDETKTHSQMIADAQVLYPNVNRDHQLFQIIMKGILSPYYLNSAEKVMTSNSGIQDNIYSTGVTFPELGLAIFTPIPTEKMILGSPLDTPSINDGLSTQCTQVQSSVYNFKNVCATSEKPTLYIITDTNLGFQRVGGISQKFKVNSNVNAIIYAQFELSSKQSSLINSLVNQKFGSLFITFNDDNLTLIGFDQQNSSKTMKKTLLLQIYGDDLSTTEAANFTSLYNNARSQLQQQLDTSSKTTGSSSPVQFEYLVDNEVNYCLLIPIKVNPGLVDNEGDLSISSSEVIFYLGFIVAEKDMIQEFRDTNDRLKYIELVSFIVISAICLLSGCIVVRYSYMISFSYENPIQTMSQLMSQIDPDYVDQEDQYEQYQSYFTSDEIKSLFEAMVTLLKNFKYSNQKFHDDDALTLLELSRAKQFYMKLGNQNGVGICCNNIGNIHMKNARYLEAISEYQEAILMGTIENEQTLEEISKERLESEKRMYLQPSASGNVSSSQPGNEAAGATLMFSPGNQNKQSRGNTKRRTFLNAGNGFVKKQVKLSGGGGNPSLQSSTIKHLNKATKDGTMSRQSQFQNEDDFEFNIEDADIENSHTNRNNAQNGIASSPNQFNEGTNLLSSYEKKMKDLFLKLDISRMRLLNRKYQLGVALFEYSTMQKDDLFHEAIRVFDKCIALSDQETFTPTIIIRKILILNKKAFSHTCLGEYENAEIAIAEAREMLIRLQTANFEDNCEESVYLFLNIFCAIPVEVLKSKIDLQDAILELARFNFRKAAIIFTRILEEGETYDSQIRKYAIVSLKNILELFSLSIPGLQPKLMKFNLRTIEIIMLVDYSKDMNADQIKTSHLRCKSIFDKINDKDKIGFVQFNDSVHENFPLQEKSLYNELLEKKIRSIPMSSGQSSLLIIIPRGKSNLYEALSVTAGLFDTNQDSYDSDNKYNLVFNPSKKIESLSQNESIRFICLFTEGNNQISESDLQSIKELMKRNRVNLMIMNICNQNANMLYLRFLANEISELGQLFQLEDSEIERYFSSLRETEMKPLLLSEYF